MGEANPFAGLENQDEEDVEEEEVSRMTGRYCCMSMILNSDLAVTQQEEDTMQQSKAEFGGNAFAALIDQGDDAEEERDMQCNQEEHHEQDEVWICSA